MQEIFKTCAYFYSLETIFYYFFT